MPENNRSLAQALVRLLSQEIIYFSTTGVKGPVNPQAKSWADTVVAIKTNNIFQQQTHSAVMARFCDVLVDGGSVIDALET